MANLSKTKTLFGFTSPRTIEKIVPEIELLTDNYSGQKWSGNSELQEQFFIDLFNSEFYYGEMMPANPALAARDRITRAPKALGFVNLKPEIGLTPAGRELLSSERKHEIITKQLLKFQLPSPYHKGFPITFHVKPYLELLRLLYTMGSLSKYEIALFGLQLTHTDKIESIKGKIKRFRKNFKKFQGSWRTYVSNCFVEEIGSIYLEEIEQNEFRTRESNDESLTKFIKTKRSNMLDYADAFYRYIRATQLATYKKRSFSLIISPHKIENVEYLLSTISPDPLAFTSDASFKEYLFSTDNITLLEEDRDQITDKLRKYKIPIKKEDPIVDLRSALAKIESDLKHQNISKTKEELKSEKNVDEISEVFSQILSKNVPDPPLFLEWNVWRALNMLNYGNRIEGNFSMDIDGMPLNTALGNQPDIEADYQKFSLIVEVTLSQGNTQFNMEGESVPRHYGRRKEELDNVDLYCLFIAPRISEGALAHYFNLNRFKTKLYGGETKIIPLTINQFVKFLNVGIESDFHDSNILHQWLENQWKFNQSCTDESAWYEHISSEIATWAS